MKKQPREKQPGDGNLLLYQGLGTDAPVCFAVFPRNQVSLEWTAVWKMSKHL